MKPIPIAAAKRVAENYDYDQVVIIARKVSEGEHCTTYGVNKENCDIAARIGDFLKFKVMGWKQETAPECEQLAQWMMQHSFATGHGDSFADLLNQLSWQVEELREATHGTK